MHDDRLASIRRRIDRLTAERGQPAERGRYVLVCARTGERPVPVANCLFPDRPSAAAAADLARAYRERLREYDADLAYHDLIASERPPQSVRPVAAGQPGADESDATDDEPEATDNGPEATDDEPEATDDGPGERSSHRPAVPDVEPTTADAPTVADRPDHLAGGDSPRATFCHRVATALFDALRDSGETGVEDAVMATYRDAASRIADPDDLCLLLLDRIAVELDARLAPRRQVAVCRAAARRLPAPAVPSSDAVLSAFERLATVDILGGYTVSPRFDLGDDENACTVAVREYALWPSDAAITTLPITVDVLRRDPRASPAFDPAVRLRDDAWAFRVETRPDADPAGVARVALQQ